jgi:hypothetical protein
MCAIFVTLHSKLTAFSLWIKQTFISCNSCPVFVSVASERVNLRL